MSLLGARMAAEIHGLPKREHAQLVRDGLDILAGQTAVALEFLYHLKCTGVLGQKKYHRLKSEFLKNRTSSSRVCPSTGTGSGAKRHADILGRDGQEGRGTNGA